MNRIKKGNILPLTFILLTALAVIVASLAFLTSTGIKNLSYVGNRARSLYIAEAGLQKAAWYLMTPTYQGGKGIAWRVAGTTESFAGGSYTIRVGNASTGNIIITAEGTYRGITRTIQALYSLYPTALDYGIVNTNNLTLGSGSQVRGDIYSEGTITNNGGSIEGDVWTPANPPDPVPTIPTLDTSYYDSEIAAAYAQNININTVRGFTNLGGGKLYDKNNMTIIGTIVGPGVICAAHDLTVKWGATIDQNIMLIAGNDLKFEYNISMGNNSTMYAGHSLNFTNSLVIADKATLISPNLVFVGGWQRINGIIFANQANLGSQSTVRGNIIGGSATLGENSSFTYDQNSRPATPPPGLDTSFSFIKGSWKEL